MTKIHDRDSNELEYRPLFAPAIVAFIISLLGVAAIFSMVFVLVNILAAGLAIYSILRIGNAQRHAGLRIAQAALLLAIGFSSFSLVNNFGKSVYIRYQGKMCGLRVAELVREGRFPEVYQYTLKESQRKPKGTDWESLYEIPEEKPESPDRTLMEYVRWKMTPPVSLLEEDGLAGELAYLGYGNLEISTGNNQIKVPCNYEYRPKSPDVAGTKFQIVFIRDYYPEDSIAVWRLLGFAIQEGPKADSEIIQVQGSKNSL